MITKNKAAFATYFKPIIRIMNKINHQINPKILNVLILSSVNKIPIELIKVSTAPKIYIAEEKIFPIANENPIAVPSGAPTDLVNI